MFVLKREVNWRRGNDGSGGVVMLPPLTTLKKLLFCAFVARRVAWLRANRGIIRLDTVDSSTINASPIMENDCGINSSLIELLLYFRFLRAFVNHFIVIT